MPNTQNGMPTETLHKEVQNLINSTYSTTQIYTDTHKSHISQFQPHFIRYNFLLTQHSTHTDMKNKQTLH